jgi:D-alanyl-lipoteichoic acid acyltransferase DltB (MBOAT superfamily)
MTFTEYDFLLFFLLVFSAYWLLKRRAWQNALLLVASYVFYAWVHPWYALLLGLSTLADYSLALGIDHNRARTKFYVGLSLALNLGVLAFFKYFNFFNDGLVNLLTSLGLRADPLLAQILLPAGLSFYTLKKLAYLLDVSRGTLAPTSDLVGFALFVAFFPQITAGPMDRAQKLLPQIQTDRVWRADNFYQAWPLIVMGFFKKLVIANMLGVAVDRVFSLKQPTLLLLAMAALGYTIQIFADFSAYTDLSRGIARLFGFDTSQNFNAPYLALTPTDFWNRWHLTLSTWLRDYIFFPLRRALLRARLPTWLTDALPPLVTMLVSGLWHGAGWNFVLWGGYFGVLIVIYQALGLGASWKPTHWWTRALAWLVMFSLLMFSFLIFRSPSVEWLATMFRTSPLVGSSDEAIAALISLSVILCYAAPLIVKYFMDLKLRPDSNWQVLYYVAATVVTFVFVNAAQPDFIYFRF